MQIGLGSQGENESSSVCIFCLRNKNGSDYLLRYSIAFMSLREYFENVSNDMRAIRSYFNAVSGGKEWHFMGISLTKLIIVIYFGKIKDRCTNLALSNIPVHKAYAQRHCL